MRRELSGWGRVPRTDCAVIAPRDEAALRAAIATGPVIARGNGRAYGDAATQSRGTIEMRHFNRLLAFDPETGQVEAEAGVLLADLIEAFLPRGWFPWVTPGTKFVTLGGAIAADVHGKNHRRDGAFRSCLDWVEVMQQDGSVVRAEPGDDLFEWTVGGMGLTGVILRAGLRLRPVSTGWIRQQMVPAPDLATAMEVFERDTGTYAVAWFDCLGQGASLGRSLVMLGDHATPEDLGEAQRAAPFNIPRRRRLKVPMDAPAFALNRFTLKAFNALYWRAGLRKAGESLVDWDSYFYPLDTIDEWNRIYGRPGFAQFQCVLPLATARPGLEALLKAISASGQGSFLAVLKRLGAQESRFSFPMEGYTLALDFPVSPKALQLLERLDAITVDHGGRFYLAKDSRLRSDTLRASDPRVGAFVEMRETGPRYRFASGQSERIGI
ncbi:FAD-binding oxidoreductase [Pseudooceanicola nanhaiensis]|uniref:FAD-binding oxidoreductase n=1 Tax=Pseudooceanicola nanhaiensis TaxID=375761 RepID=UPI001CD7EB48|nr:FAD-binding oxidoreductase [Pseudooceanicola nanhaiensis]MCA0919097.1 FAD-binding oxidoreductase [Pseudooceanicola nanhaiensis]